MIIRHRILNFIHEKIFRHDKGREPNKFTNLIYAILMPICYLSERNTLLRYDWNRDVFIIDNMEFTGKFLRMVHDRKIYTERIKPFKLPSNYKDWPQEYVDYLNIDWNDAHRRGSGKWRTRFYKVFLNNQKKEGKMKVNLEIAKICHKVNRDYCIDEQLVAPPKWDELPLKIQESIVAGVALVIANPKITPTEMHQKWCDYKASEGWKLGEVKDFKLKTHPNLVMFKDLPSLEKRKDVIFIRTVKREMKR